MKMNIKRTLMAFVAVATLAFGACSPDDPKPENNGDNNTENPTDNPSGNSYNNLTSMAGTSWVGIYNDTYQGYPAVITWSLDFTDETNGGLLMELNVAGQDQTPSDLAFTYTFSGNNGTITIGNLGSTTFTYDPTAATITMSLGLRTEDGGQLGGSTVFHPRN